MTYVVFFQLMLYVLPYHTEAAGQLASHKFKTKEISHVTLKKISRQRSVPRLYTARL